MPLAFLGAACAAMLGAILLRTGGVFSYTLDDPYIHLALAEEIARGHYGVNPGEAAAPSSSVLWPFLLAPWARLPIAPLVPFAYNLAAAVGLVVVYQRVLSRSLGPAGTLRGSLAVGLIGAGLIVGTNVVGLAFTGMEHTLQLLLTALAVWGLWQERETGAVPRWLAAVLVLGPLVRYENLAVTGPALVYLFARGHRKTALGAGGVVGAALGGFSLFLYTHDLGVLPSSVLAKSTGSTGEGSLSSILLRNAAANAQGVQGRMLIAATLPLLAAALSARRAWVERGVALTLVAAVGLHLVGGSFGWLSRYEMYIWAAVLAGLALLFGPSLRAAASREPVWKAALLVAVALGALGLPYLEDQTMLPESAQSIYDQQFQVHRLLTEHYPHPVAVNDLGWTTFRNDRYVLDILGLGSHEVIKLAMTEPNSDWITRLADEHGVEVALTYFSPERFPEVWTLVGTLHRRAPRLTKSRNRVFVYARDRAAAEALRPALREWAATLPPGARFAFRNEAP